MTLSEFYSSLGESLDEVLERLLNFTALSVNHWTKFLKDSAWNLALQSIWDFF